jgi:hypothetical protein
MRIVDDHTVLDGNALSDYDASFPESIDGIFKPLLHFSQYAGEYHLANPLSAST